MTLSVVMSFNTQHQNQSTKEKTGGFVLKIYKELSENSHNSMIREHTTSMKMCKNLNRHLAKEDIQIVNKHTKIYSPSSTIRKWQIVTHLLTAELKKKKWQYQLLEDVEWEELSIPGGMHVQALWKWKPVTGNLTRAESGQVPSGRLSHLQLYRNCRANRKT